MIASSREESGVALVNIFVFLSWRKKCRPFFSQNYTISLISNVKCSNSLECLTLVIYSLQQPHLVLSATQTCNKSQPLSDSDLKRQWRLKVGHRILSYSWGPRHRTAKSFLRSWMITIKISWSVQLLVQCLIQYLYVQITINALLKYNNLVWQMSFIKLQVFRPEVSL